MIKLCHIRLRTFVILAVIMVYELGSYSQFESHHPTFRSDYRYEKKFKSFYKLHKTALDWFDARRYCRAEGARLMVPGTVDEAELIPLLSAPILHKYNATFLGIHSLYSRRVFVTDRGNLIQRTFLDLLWDANEPKYFTGSCVAAYRNGRLSLNQCVEHLPFICKVKEKNVRYYNECSSYNPRWKLLSGYKECYFINPDPRRWDQAYAICLAAGGYLYVPKSKKQHLDVVAFYREFMSKHGNMSETTYIGMSDHFKLHHYRSIFGAPMEKKKYNYANGTRLFNRKNLNSSSCGCMGKSGTIYTMQCDLLAYFVCEKLRTNADVFVGL